MGGNASLRGLILECLRTRKPETVEELYRVVKARLPGLEDEGFAEEVKALQAEGLVRLIRPPPQASSYLEYMKLMDENLWFYLVLGSISATLASIYLLPSIYPFIIMRYLVGSIFVLFLPGFAVVQALYPVEGELNGLERLALSIGLSMAITPLVGLILNYTPWGIRLNPIVVALTVLTAFISLLGTYRRFNRALLRLRAWMKEKQAA
jgi:hypothetical protein